ncbi:hypothetical protein PG993_010499 [Apiospora rasikravindrae]|uniref:Uncharacterized protein n=1 Tax=Apiospora rasikravindrae TaxID=990691 RepID=A0ABR1SMG9_9PEZI
MKRNRPRTIAHETADHTTGATIAGGPAKNNQPPPQKRLVSSNHILTARSQPNSPSLLDMPLEIRNQIYSYFVTIDQDYEHEGEDYNNGECIDVSILHINQQIRHEAWNCLIETNLWVRLIFRQSDDLRSFNFEGMNAEPQAYLPYDRVSEEHSKRLVQETALHLWVGESCETDANGDLDSSEFYESVMFAYHPLHYNMFLSSVAGSDVGVDSLTIQVHPKTMNIKSRFAKLLEPLCTLRGIRNVSFAGVEYCAALQSLAQDMQRPLAMFDDEWSYRIDVADLIKIQQYHQRLGHNAELRGYYSDAMCHYQVGGLVKHMFPDASGRVRGSPELNTCHHRATELSLGFSRSVHKYVTQSKKPAPSSTLDTQFEAKTIQRSIASCCDALEFIGLTDSQRREAHLYRAFTLFRVAEYLSNIPQLERRSSPYIPSLYYDRSSRRSGIPQNDHVGTARLAAARDLFYAKKVEPSHDILANLDEDDKVTYRKVYLITAQRFPIANYEVPLLGTWTGDPDVWKEWVYAFPRQYLLMKLFQLRLNQDSDGGIEGEEELRRQYAAEGITWSHDPDNYLEITSDTW